MSPATTPRVGDKITTAAQLDALPPGAVLRDHLTGAVGIVLDDTDERGLYRVEFAGSGNARVDRLVVLYVPGEQAGPSTDDARAALLGTDTTEGALDLDRPAGDDTPYFEGIVEGYNRAVEVVIATLDRAAARAETTTERDALAAQLAAAVEDTEDREQVFSVMASLMDRTTIALKGDPPPLTSHDQSDLPEVAARLVSELRVVERTSRANAQAHMAAERRARQAEEKLADIVALLNDPDRAAGKTTTGKGWQVTHLHAADVHSIIEREPR